MIFRCKWISREKGRGILATRNISSGETIALEAGLFVGSVFKDRCSTVSLFDFERGHRYGWSDASDGSCVPLLAAMLRGTYDDSNEQHLYARIVLNSMYEGSVKLTPALLQRIVPDLDFFRVRDFAEMKRAIGDDEEVWQLLMDSPMTARRALDIIMQNAFDAPGKAGADEATSAIYPFSSLLNHGEKGSDNCSKHSYYVNESIRVLRLYALRDIAKGEELTHTYHPSKSIVERSWGI